MDLLSVRFFLYAPPCTDRLLDERFERLYPTVFRHGRLRVLENQRALPRLFLVPASGARRVSREEAWACLQSKAFDPARIVLLEEAPTWPAGLDAPPGARDQVEPLFAGSNSLEAYVFSPVNAVLVASEAWAPGWRVDVDGAPARLLRVDACLRGVAVGPGGHNVRFVYRPALFRLGLALSVLGMLACLMLGFGVRRWSV